MKTYEELIQIPTFEDRLLYLKTESKIGDETFGSKRYLNQILYRSPEWKIFRNSIVLRDKGFDLAVEGFEIVGLVVVHHINPITIYDVINRSYKIFDPSNAITTSDNTHKRIHYEIQNGGTFMYVERKPNDTCPWKL